MYVIAGLGNPGREYAKTRHNMGFRVIDMLSEKSGIAVDRSRHRALIGKGKIAGKQVMLVKPQTYVNDSGRSLGEILRYYDIEPEDLIVIYDDMDLEPGAIRIRKKGSAGSHNGMKSIITHLGEGNFPRIRVGIGRPEMADWKDFVLGKVPDDDEAAIGEGVTKAADAVVKILEDGIDRAMNSFNNRGKAKDAGDDGE